MAFLRMVYYEIKNRLVFSMSVAALLIIPVILIMAVRPLSELFLSERGGVANLPIAITDLEKSIYTQVFINQVVSEPSIRNNIDIILAEDEQEAFALIESDEVAGIIIIPANFSQSMMSGNFEYMEFYANPARPLHASLIAGGLDSGAYLMSAVQNALLAVYEFCGRLQMTEGDLNQIFNREMLVMVSKAMNRNDTLIRMPVTQWEGAGILLYYGISIVLLFMALVCCMGIASYYQSRKRLHARLRLSGARNYAVLLEILSNTALLALYGFCVIPAVMFAYGRFDVTRTLAVFGLIFVIALSMSSMAVFTAFISRSLLRAVIIWVLIIIFLMLASGCIIPLYFLPDFIPGDIQYFTPFYWWRRVLLFIVM